MIYPFILFHYRIKQRRTLQSFAKIEIDLNFRDKVNPICFPDRNGEYSEAFWIDERKRSVFW